MAKSQWIKITDEQPEIGEYFLGVLWSINKGYDPHFCHRDEDGYHVDDIQSPPPGWLKSMGYDPEKDYTIMLKAPDYWLPLRVEELVPYEGCPTQQILEKPSEVS